MITLQKIRQTCAGCPSQWEAVTSTGLNVYIRYRYGHLGWGIGSTPDDAVHDWRRRRQAGEDIHLPPDVPDGVILLRDACSRLGLAIAQDADVESLVIEPWVDEGW